jgi:hypothetical protein
MNGSNPSTLTDDGAGRPEIDLTVPVSRTTSDLAAALDAVGSDLRELCASALQRGDFGEVTQIVEAAHAVHRAALALTTDTSIAAPLSPTS